MKTWNIFLNGKPYSRYYSNLRSMKHAPMIAQEWLSDWKKLGNGLPAGTETITASLYVPSILDTYGRGRGG